MFGSEFYRISLDLRSKPIEGFNSFTSDYRYSEISLLGFDMPSMPLDSFSSLEPLKAKLLGNGVVRLFRDFYEEDAPDLKSLGLSHPGDDTMLSILAVPTYYTASDLLGFIGDFYLENLTHVRILKSERPNRFLVLLKFKDAVKAAEFQYHYDGKPFNAMEPEMCHVVFVKSVVLELDEEETPTDDMIPFLLRDPFTSYTALSEIASAPDHTDLAQPVVSAELPTCPVCLERLDYEVSGLLTIPCQHTFHCMCLSKWRDDTCPVCRYTNDVSNHTIRRSVRRLLQLNLRMQQLQIREETAQLAPPAKSTSTSETCMACNTQENLWVCLICGNVGCSRYAPEQHSLKHFVESGHCFAMELSTSRVWDYAGDKYVHRLIASESDGKIVELPQKGTANQKSNLKEEDSEYAELLLSQLISQREYYELLLNEKGTVGKRLRRGSSLNENARYTDLEAKVNELSVAMDKMTESVVPAYKRKIDMMNMSIRLSAQELQEANSLNEGLSAKVDYLTAQVKQLKEENEELAQTSKDLMFYLESQEKFKDQPEDVREGTIVVTQKKKSTKKKKK
ncbi:hypothetical protein PUMCH_004687 [Australozyma saopauloensis]|uniref:Uncharacterized protein n=1 Tax=Australozyma saopauloensis TaxID=291208 RepID=A0AAX4HG30_9ASCO|nr:hypothetical protein PUMCH_004687 [[Candida] saopauloensis]